MINEAVDNERQALERREMKETLVDREAGSRTEGDGGYGRAISQAIEKGDRGSGWAR